MEKENKKEVTKLETQSLPEKNSSKITLIIKMWILHMQLSIENVPLGILISFLLFVVTIVMILIVGLML